MNTVPLSIILLFLFAGTTLAATFSQPPGNDESSSCPSSYSISGNRAPVSFTVDSSWGGYTFDVRVYDTSGSSHGLVESWTVPSGGGTYTKNIVIPSSACGKNVYVMMDGYLLYNYYSCYFSAQSCNSLSITSPIATTKVASGSSLAIRWSSSGLSSVKIQFSNSFSTGWTTVTSSTSATTGSYTWTVPASTGPGVYYYIRISDVSDSTFFEESSYFEVTGVSGSGCEILDTFQATSSSNCPNFMDHDEDSLTMSFRCWGYAGYEVDLRLYRGEWLFDSYVSLGRFSFTDNNETKTATVAIPLSFRICSFQPLYFTVYYSMISYYSGCYFLPKNHDNGLACDRVVYPTGGEVIAAGPSRVEWELEDPAEWKGYTIEWYLYKEVDLWPDPWWYPGQILATTLPAKFSYNIKDLGITTSEGSKWYVAGYYRAYIIFTFSVAESNRFSIDDGVAADLICSLEDGQEKFGVDCCKHLSTTTDLCRLPVPLASLAFEARDVSLHWVYEPVMCEAPIQFEATVRTHWIDGDGIAGHFDVTVTLEYEAAELLNQEFYQEVVSESTLTGLVSASGLNQLVEADSGLKLVTTCEDNDLDLKLSLYGKAAVLGLNPVEMEFMELYAESFPLPSQPPQLSGGIPFLRASTITATALTVLVGLAAMV